VRRFLPPPARVTVGGVGGQELEVNDSTGVIAEALQIIMRTNRCDAVSARDILTATAARNRLDEVDVAATLVALSRTPRRPRPIG